MNTETFIEALNEYRGHNIWQELIYQVVLNDDEVDVERCANDPDASSTCIFLKSGQNIIYYESAKTWR